MRAIAFTIALMGIAISSSPAIAGKKDDAWASCLWETMPQSAANWVDMPDQRASYREDDVDLYSITQLRLQAACHGKMIPEGKSKPPTFKPKKIRESLRDMRPQSIGDDTVEPKLYRCFLFYDNVANGDGTIVPPNEPLGHHIGFWFNGERVKTSYREPLFRSTDPEGATLGADRIKCNGYSAAGEPIDA